MMIVQRAKVAGGHVMTGEALKKLQQQMKENREERRLTVRHLCSLSTGLPVDYCLCVVY